MEDGSPSTLRTISSSTAFALTVNYIVGTGAFGLPYGVMRAGTVLSFACLAGFAVLSSICLCYVIETMARAGGIIEAEKGKLRGVVSTGHKPDESDPLLLAAPHAPTGQYVAHIGYSKLDFSLLAQLFGGRPAYAFVHVVMMLYSQCALWAYAAVFASSVDSIVFQYVLGESCNIYVNPSWGCSAGYTVCVLVFAVIVTYLSLQEVGDQAVMQQLLTGYRFAAFLAMIATCAIAFFHRNRFDAHAAQSAPTFASLPAVQWSGFGLIFCTTAVSFDVHWNVADVLLPLRDKRSALRIALSALMCSAAFYTVIALVCALEFGPSTFPLVTLNWNGYTGRGGGWQEGPMSGGSLFVKLFIILFPVCNQCSVYPRQRHASHAWRRCLLHRAAVLIACV